MQHISFSSSDDTDGFTILFIFIVMRYKQLVYMQSRFSCILEFGNVFTKKILRIRENNFRF